MNKEVIQRARNEANRAFKELNEFINKKHNIKTEIQQKDFYIEKISLFIVYNKALYNYVEFKCSLLAFYHGVTLQNKLLGWGWLKYNTSLNIISKLREQKERLPLDEFIKLFNRAYNELTREHKELKEINTRVDKALKEQYAK